MFWRALAATVIVSALTGCVAAPLSKPGLVAWDGLGRDPNLRRMPTTHRNEVSVKPDSNIEREKVLGGLRPFSDQWWIVRDEIDAENDRRLSSKLVICQGCIDRAPQRETTGSIW